MKFSHLADCHIGSWRDEKLNGLSTEAFIRALDISIQEQVDFILIAGDIFNTSLPAIEKLKAATKKLKEVKDYGIPVYIIPGSHDFSPSGKTMLDVLEHAGLFVNVVKGSVTAENKLQLRFTIDPKTGAKITGLLGRKGSLERRYYETLDPTTIEQEEGFKIFLFHTALAELKPVELEKMDAQPVSFLPKNCNYYAGGHVHIVKHASLPGYEHIVYPGPLFPNSFSELEKLQHGGFYLYDNAVLRYIPILLHPVVPLCVAANHCSSQEVYKLLSDKIASVDPKNSIVLLRVTGELSEGKVADIDFKALRELLEHRGSWCVLKNTSLLKSKEFSAITVKGENTHDIEEKVLAEHIGQFSSSLFSADEQRQLTTGLLHLLNTEKLEGERVVDFENRVRKDVQEVIKL